MRTAIIIADEGEFAPLVELAAQYGGKTLDFYSYKRVDFAAHGTEYTAIMSGIGKANAAAATAALLVQGGIERVVNIGLSGSLSDDVKSGLVVGVRFMEHDFDMTPLGYTIGQKPQQKIYQYNADAVMNDMLLAVCKSASIGVFLTGDRFIADNNEKNRLVKLFGGDYCDMETAAVAGVCHKFSVPFASIRIISDSADDTAGESYRNMNSNEPDILIKTVIRAFSDDMKN